MVRCLFVFSNAFCAKIKVVIIDNISNKPLILIGVFGINSGMGSGDQKHSHHWAVLRTYSTILNNNIVGVVCFISIQAKSQDSQFCEKTKYIEIQSLNRKITRDKKGKNYGLDVSEL